MTRLHVHNSVAKANVHMFASWCVIKGIIWWKAKPWAFHLLVSVQYAERRWWRSSCVSDVSFLQGQQLMDLENKLRVAKEELEKAALDKVRTLKVFLWIWWPLSSYLHVICPTLVSYFMARQWACPQKEQGYNTTRNTRQMHHCNHFSHISMCCLQESQLKALKDTVHLCFSSVLHSQTANGHRFPATPTHLFRYAPLINSSRVTFQQPHAKVKYLPNWHMLTLCEISIKQAVCNTVNC